MKRRNKTRFEKCVESVKARGSAYSPRGVCAAAGRKKYGKAAFQRMAAAGRRRQNSSGDLEERAAELTEAWHGRPVKSVRDVVETRTDRDVLADLGTLEEIEIWDADGRYVTPIQFSGDDVRMCVSVSNEEEIRKAEAEGQRRSNSIYIVGGDQDLDASVFGVETDKDLEVLGLARSITYRTVKHHLGDREMQSYQHNFAEEGGEEPTVLYDCLDHKILFAGGDYFIDPRDYDGKHSAGIRN